MTNKITLYGSDIVPERNMSVDSVDEYLANDVFEVLEINDIQFLPRELNTKLVIQNDKLNEFERGFVYNYLVFESSPTSKYYYFIIDHKWKSAHSIELTLMMDTIHTYKDLITDFSDKTEIIREHRDRITYTEQDGKKFYYQTIDRFNEVENLPKYFINKKLPRLLVKYYLVYKSNVDPDSAKVTPINCYFASDAAMKIEEATTKPTQTKTTPALHSAFMNGARDGQVIFMGLQSGENARVRLYYNNESGGVSSKEFYINQETILVLIYRDGIISEAKPNILYYKYNPNTYEYEFQSRDEDPLGIGSGGERRFVTKIDILRSDIIRSNSIRDDTSTNYYHYLNAKHIYDYPTGSFSEIYTSPISEIDRSDPKNIKIIQVPCLIDGMSFMPNSLLNYNKSRWVYDSSIGLLRLKDLDTKFAPSVVEGLKFEPNKQLFVKYPTYYPETSRIDEIEPKLFHSNFYNERLIYDSFILDFRYENLKPHIELNSSRIYEDYNVTFKASNTITSSFAFNVSLDISNYYMSDAYEGYLIVKRNNELPIYNSAYINYINNGYNYDKKNADRNRKLSWINTGLSMGGSVLSMLGGKDFGFASGVGLATSGLQSIVSNVERQAQAEQNIEQKMHSALNSAASVSGSDDVDLLDFYHGNIPQIYTFEISEEMKKIWSDMFYYFGYSHPVREIPNVKSRYWFNFLQCNPVFNGNALIIVPKELRDDIYNRFKIGITYYHRRPVSSYIEQPYDFKQEYANGEIFLYNEGDL